VIRVSNADYLARPLRLTPTEATAIIVALRAMRGTAGPTPARSVDRTLAKLEAAARHGRRTPLVEPGEDDDAGRDRASSLLEDAVAPAAGRLTYYVPPATRSPSGSSTRAAWSPRPGVAYLDAWCHSAEAPRLFRLDRIHEADRARLGRRDRPGAAARPVRRALPAVAGDHLVTSRCSRRPAGWSSTTRSSRCGPARRTVEVDLLSPTSGGCAPPDAAPPDARVLSPSELDSDFRRRHSEHSTCTRPGLTKPA
jgi:proteasome accessory factor C